MQEMKAQDKGMDLITSQNVEWEGRARTPENTNIPRHTVQKNERDRVLRVEEDGCHRLKESFMKQGPNRLTVRKN